MPIVSRRHHSRRRRGRSGFYFDPNLPSKSRFVVKTVQMEKNKVGATSAGNVAAVTGFASALQAARAAARRGGQRDGIARQPIESVVAIGLVDVEVLVAARAQVADRVASPSFAPARTSKGFLLRPQSSQSSRSGGGASPRRCSITRIVQPMHQRTVPPADGRSRRVNPTDSSSAREFLNSWIHELRILVLELSLE